MSKILSQNFNAETLGTPPIGWTPNPAGSCLVVVDPDGAGLRGRCVEMYDSVGSCFCNYDLAVKKAAARFRFYAFKQYNNYGVGDIGIHDSTPQSVGSLTFQNDGKIYIIDGSETTISIASYAANTWYLFEWFYYSDKTFDLWIDGVQIIQGWQWRNYSTTTSLLSDLKFGASIGVDFYFDDVTITDYDAEIAAPERLVISANFESDITTALLSATAPDGTTPDEFSGDYLATNAQEDSLGAPWRTLDAANGYHTWTLNYSTTPPYSRTMQLIAILGHNLASITGTFRLTLRAKSSPSTSWLTPDFEIDLSAKKADAMILAWLDTAAYTYWQLALYAGGVSGVSWFEIGRIIMTTFFVPTHNMEAEYNLTRVDPSLTSDTEGGTRISRIKKSYRKLTIPLADMELSDQILLDALYAEAGAHAPWLVVLEPLADPIGKSIYGYIAPELSLDRVLLDYGTTSLELKEIVL